MTLKETILFIKNVFSVHFREYVRHRPLAQLVRVFRSSGLVCFSLKLRCTVLGIGCTILFPFGSSSFCRHPPVHTFSCIVNLVHHRHFFNPLETLWSPSKYGKVRPLGLPTPSGGDSASKDSFIILVFLFHNKKHNFHTHVVNKSQYDNILLVFKSVCSNKCCHAILWREPRVTGISHCVSLFFDTLCVSFLWPLVFWWLGLG